MAQSTTDTLVRRVRRARGSTDKSVRRTHPARSLVLQRHARTITLSVVMQLTLSRTLLIHALILIGVGGAIVAYRQMQVKPLQIEEMPEPKPEEMAEIVRLSKVVSMSPYGSQGVDLEKAFRDLIALEERYLVPEHPEIVPYRQELAFLLSYRGKYEEAETEYRVVLKILQRVMGADAADTLECQTRLASVLVAEEKYAAAEQEYRQIYTLRELALGPEHPDTLSTQRSLAWVLQTQGKYAEAEREEQALQNIQRRGSGASR